MDIFKFVHYELEIYKPTIIMSWEKVYCVTSYNVGRSRGVET